VDHYILEPPITAVELANKGFKVLQPLFTKRHNFSIEFKQLIVNWWVGKMDEYINNLEIMEELEYLYNKHYLSFHPGHCDKSRDHQYKHSLGDKGQNCQAK
jgi:hypothetical protein